MAVVDLEGVRKRCNIAFVRDPKVGEYVLIHAGFAIQKWSESNVTEYQAIMDEMRAVM